MTTPLAVGAARSAREVSLDDARTLAFGAGHGVPGTSRTVALADAIGATLAGDLIAVATIPPAAVSAMDGWAVGGTGPWRLDGTARMGAAPGAPLPPGTARTVSTGAAVPPGTTAVLRVEHGNTDGTLVHALSAPAAGADIRPAGDELHAGTRIASAGSVVTPGLAAAAAVAGLDTLCVRSVPRVTVLRLGDEIVPSGIPAPGQVRDAFHVPLSAALTMMGLHVDRVVHVPDDATAVRAALLDIDSDVVVTTGGTGHSRVDHLVPAISSGDGRVVFRGVAVRPGHPTVLAHLGVQPVLGLPGNPFAAFAALTTIGAALVAGALGAPMPETRAGLTAADLPTSRPCPRLVAVRDTAAGVIPTNRQGAGMATALTDATALALVGPDGASAGQIVPLFPLPWRC